MKRAALPLALFVLAAVVHFAAARVLSGVDLVESLVVRRQLAYGALAVMLLVVRLFALFVAPGWILATLVVGSEPQSGKRKSSTGTS
jgi:hypothetical protein